MKINALIVDDEHSGRSSIGILLKKNHNHLLQSIKTASNLVEAINFVKEEFFNIIFLDIQLGSTSGFDLLPYLSSATKVVFITAYSEYAIRAIKEHAFDYILKPISPIEFNICIAKYEKEFPEGNGKRDYILVKLNGESVPIPVTQIEYLEAEGNYSIIYTRNNKKFVAAKTLKVIYDYLGEDFIRIHKSYIVNKLLVKSFKKDSITTINNKCLPVSRVGAKELSRYF
ncbi:LytTR family DNA-binding domain-containing protein [soil metagenome]